MINKKILKQATINTLEEILAIVVILGEFFFKLLKWFLGFLLLISFISLFGTHPGYTLIALVIFGFIFLLVVEYQNLEKKKEKCGIDEN